MRKSVFGGCDQRFCAFLRRKWQAMCCCIKRKSKKGNKVSSTQARIITVGVMNPESKQDNKIKTSKYSFITFLPRNLTEQFRRVINFYFLIVTVIAIVIDSPVSPMTSIVPLTFMVAVTAAKQGYEDWQRHLSDNSINHSKVQTIHEGVIRSVRSETVKPGTIVRVGRGHEVPADLVLLCASGQQDRCFVTTANLDGETNLKTIRVPLPLSQRDSSDDLTKLHCINSLPRGVRLEVPPPVADLYKFSGRMLLPSGSAPLTAENLMLRGSRVKTTDWAVGCAIYTGEETKLALNSKFTGNKFSSSERIINRFLLVYVVLLIAAMVGCLVTKLIVEINNPEMQLYIGEIPINAQTVLNDLFSFLLLFYYIVPMSFYVTLEMFKFFGAKFITWDEDFHISGRRAAANTSDLNEELGQVEVLFSDKTGTLTKNMMVFKACSINGTVYEERDSGFFQIDGTSMDINKEDVKFFMKMISLCHDVRTAPEDLKKLSARLSSDRTEALKLLRFFRKKYEVAHTSKTAYHDSMCDIDLDRDTTPLNYQGSSPDEKALVEAAARAGFTFIGEERNMMTIEILEAMEEYERLRMIEFTSDRKRMSVIVKDKSGVIWIFCKGAEMSVFPLCTNSELVEQTSQNIKAFAELGLRTLAYAYRVIPPEEYKKLVEETTRTDSQAHKVADILKEFESKLTLIGATAVEDCLQDGVAETLLAFRQAGISTWVLTGDKVETAINVSQSCEHLSPDDRKMMLVKMKDFQVVKQGLEECEKIIAEPSWRSAALIVDGETVETLLHSELTPRFVQLSFQCSAVLCCRLSPLQKAQIVKVVKNSPRKPITAAIGDGANDISMIQEAHVGFGIYGREGHQAARSADYAFTDFAMLRKLILVLGHWYYQRLATLIYYFCYKNMVLSLVMFIFQFHSAFSTQSNYDSLHLTFYNLAYTSWPCFVLSLTEQRWPAEKLIKQPEMYKTISRGKLLAMWNLIIWTFVAFFHSGVIYGFTLFAFQHDLINSDAKTSDLWSLGTTMFHLSVILVNLKLLIETYYHTFWLHFSVWFSILICIAVNILYSFFDLPLSDGDVLGSFTRLVSSPTFWALNILVIVTALSVDFFARVYRDSKAHRRVPIVHSEHSIRTIAQIYSKKFSRLGQSLTRISSAPTNPFKPSKASKDLKIARSEENITNLYYNREDETNSINTKL